MSHYQHPQRKRHLKPEPKLLKLQADWRQEYRESAGLLEEKLLNYVRLNRQLGKHINNRYQLIELYEGIIILHLTAFSDAYIQKFIQPNINAYCFRFMEQLRPVLLGYLVEAHIGVFDFRLCFKLKDLEMVKTMALSLES